MELNTKTKENIDKSWGAAMEVEFKMPYFRDLKTYLSAEGKTKIIYPPSKLIFSAFNHTPFDTVSVVIIGQDPYHGPNQANGLCFSVSNGIKPPPSLVNVFKEIENDLSIPVPPTGNLEPWAKQGVFLLNATLTVQAGNPGAHQGKGWETFTDSVIKKLSTEKEGLVFLLWGKFAQAKEILINTSKHYVLKAAHPSPFSAYNGFMGCKHFSKTNELLAKQGKKTIDWRLIKN